MSQSVTGFPIDCLVLSGTVNWEWDRVRLGFKPCPLWHRELGMRPGEASVLFWYYRKLIMRWDEAWVQAPALDFAAVAAQISGTLPRNCLSLMVFVVNCFCLSFWNLKFSHFPPMLWFCNVIRGDFKFLCGQQWDSLRLPVMWRSCDGQVTHCMLCCLKNCTW